MNLEETMNKVFTIFDSNSVILNKCDEKYFEEELEECIEEDVHPLEIIFRLFEFDEMYYVETYDDCHSHHYKDYYKGAMTKFSKSTNGKFQFTDIKEIWNDNGDIILSYKINEDSKEIKFNYLDMPPVIPEEFTGMLQSMLYEYSLKTPHIKINIEEIGEVHFFLPGEVIDQLNDLELIHIEGSEAKIVPTEKDVEQVKALDETIIKKQSYYKNPPPKEFYEVSELAQKILQAFFDLGNKIGMDNREMSGATGLSQSQLDKGISELESLGHVTSKKLIGGVHYRIDLHWINC